MNTTLTSYGSSAKAPALTQLRLLNQDLCECPADATDEGCQQHHEEALQIELRRLKREHEKASSDQKDHQNQEWVLVQGREEGTA